jgi:hypothetical protein
MIGGRLAIPDRFSDRIDKQHRLLPNGNLRADEGEIKMEDKAKIPDERNARLWAERLENAKDDPRLTRQLEAFKRVMEENSETLQRLADS